MGAVPSFAALSQIKPPLNQQRSKIENDNENENDWENDWENDLGESNA
jgi:hypothetical protein